VATTELTAIRTRVAMVITPYAFVYAPVADLRATPSDDAELVDQLHYLEMPMPRVLASRDGWHYVQAEDHYFGWIKDDAVQVMPGNMAGRLVGVALATIYSEPDRSSDVLGLLPAGTSLSTKQIPEPPEGWLMLPSSYLERALGARSAWVSLDDAVSVADLPHRPPTATDLIATAEAFLGVPYLWGGTTALGLDCSGYVQQVYRLNGIRLDRDAHQQAMEGRAVDVPAPGDLIFFGTKGAVTHVALATGARTFLNAPERGRKVERGDLADGRTVLAIRRYLP
jgi:cell wall-associated NlpC family hydrolase